MEIEDLTQINKYKEFLKECKEDYFDDLIMFQIFFPLGFILIATIQNFVSNNFEIKLIDFYNFSFNFLITMFLFTVSHNLIVRDGNLEKGKEKKLWILSVLTLLILVISMLFMTANAYISLDNYYLVAITTIVLFGISFLLYSYNYTIYLKYLEEKIRKLMNDKFSEI